MAVPKRNIPDRFLGNHQHDKKRTRSAPKEEAEQENVVTSANVLPIATPPPAVSLPTEIVFGKRGVRSLGGAAVVRTRTLYLANVPFSATSDQIAALFRSYGRVAAVRLPQMHGRPSGRAYVDLEAENAERAATELNGVSLSGRKLLVELARESQAYGSKKVVAEPTAAPEAMTC